MSEHYKLFLFTCFGGCATGAAAAKACLKLWEERPAEIKIACLPAVPIPAKAAEIRRSADKRLLVDACALRCGKKLFDKYRMTYDGYLELTSELGLPKEKKPSAPGLEKRVLSMLRAETARILKR